MPHNTEKHIPIDDTAPIPSSNSLTIPRAIELIQDIITYQYSASQSDKGDALRIAVRALHLFQLMITNHLVTSAKGDLSDVSLH